jgi:hypothetical protein
MEYQWSPLLGCKFINDQTPVESYRLSLFLFLGTTLCAIVDVAGFQS